jgi:NitT/TauT family transport system ATP-binding protein
MGARAETPRSASDLQRKLRLQGISRRFEAPGGTIQALEKIDLDIREGELLCIVGPSGCGKSTLLNLIAGLDQPSEGGVWVDGRRVEGPGTDRIVIFQELGLFPWLSVRENVEFGLRMKGVPREERCARARHYLRLVHLTGFETSYVHQLSGGMKQRVALARSLATEPDVLLMDEPFAALDAQTRDLLHEELERIWAETHRTIVFVTHNVREAVRLGDRVVVLTFRPGHIKSQFPIHLPRPRHLEDPALALVAREVLAQLKEEINKAVAEEFKHEENP